MTIVSFCRTRFTLSWGKFRSIFSKFPFFSKWASTFPLLQLNKGSFQKTNQPPVLPLEFFCHEKFPSAARRPLFERNCTCMYIYVRLKKNEKKNPLVRWCVCALTEIILWLRYLFTHNLKCESWRKKNGDKRGRLDLKSCRFKERGN